MRNRVTTYRAMVAGMLLAGCGMAAHGADKEVLQKLYVGYLKEQGYAPEVDSDGDVRFKHEGKTFFIQVDQEDPQFFRIVLPNIWLIESAEERAKVLVAANASTGKSKVAKVYPVQDNVWVSAELLVAKPEDFKGIFKRTLSVLEAGMRNFAGSIQE